MALVSVTKCQGTGNDFIILDARGHADLPYAELARTLCGRRFSVGADGLLVIEHAHDRSAAAAMRTFNADGSEAEMCGNGIRCVARYLYERDQSATRLTIQTLAGPMQTAIVDWQGATGVRVEMSIPAISVTPDNHAHGIRIDDELAPAYAVTVGNRHIVVFTKRDPSSCDLERVTTVALASRGDVTAANVELVSIADNRLKMRVYERGVGETWACGTGACAAAAAAIAAGLVATPVLVESKGGVVSVAWDGPGCPAVLTGNAELVFHTEVDVNLKQNVGARRSVAPSGSQVAP